MNWAMTFEKRELSLESLERNLKALRLLGKPIAFANDQTVTYTVQSITWDGMIKLEGKPGEFDPDQFVIVEKTQAVS